MKEMVSTDEHAWSMSKDTNHNQNSLWRLTDYHKHVGKKVAAHLRHRAGIKSRSSSFPIAPEKIVKQTKINAL